MIVACSEHSWGDLHLPGAVLAVRAELGVRKLAGDAWTDGAVPPPLAGSLPPSIAPALIAPPRFYLAVALLALIAGFAFAGDALRQTLFAVLAAGNIRD